ncbi:MAG: glutamate-5-semialdehyde dehydrogenase [Rickettsiales bacterium]|nr:glutamate-5-semialdehyde dehydrogenase [Rickettsiales bacterium]
MKQKSFNMDDKLVNEIEQLCKNAKTASYALQSASSETKNSILKFAAQAIIDNKELIKNANNQDLTSAKIKNLSAAMIDRLTLNDSRIESIAKALLDICDLEDPVGKVIWSNDRPNGLKIKRVTVPLGLLAVIYESRPNVTADAFALCLKSGNAVILKPGSESFATSKCIFEILVKSVENFNLPGQIVNMVPNSSREIVDILLSMDSYIDVVVPRGGKNLIRKVQDASKIPVFKHLDGNCHTYIHANADIKIAKSVLFNAKLRRTGICGATESVIIDKTIIDQASNIFKDLHDEG